MKKLLLFAIAIITVVSVLLCGCEREVKDYDNLGEYAGTWSAEDGAVIEFNADAGRYTYRTASGRIGTGSYRNVVGDRMIEFDSFLYNIKKLDDDRITFIQNGSGDAESLEGPVFVRDIGASVSPYDVSVLEGTWTNEFGETLVFDTEKLECSHSTDYSGGVSSICDGDDGKGWYVYTGTRCYIIFTESGDVRFEPEEGYCRGLYEKQ